MNSAPNTTLTKTELILKRVIIMALIFMNKFPRNPFQPLAPVLPSDESIRTRYHTN